MRKILTLLVASTALTAAIGVPAWSAMRGAVDESPRRLAAPSQDGAHAMPLVLASDDDEGDDDGNRGSSGRGDDDEDDDEDEDEDGGSRGGASNPASAGTVPPPQNGLFGNGAPPQVQVN